MADDPDPVASPSMTQASPGPDQSPPPGWYPDPSGQQRWWDGQQWGVYASQQPSTGGTDPRTMAMLAHLLGIFTGFLGPLVIYLVNGDRDPYVRHHAAEALNFQLSVLIATIASFILMFVLIGFVLIFVVMISALVLAIMGTIASYRGEWWKYPVNIRMVSGAAY